MNSKRIQYGQENVSCVKTYLCCVFIGDAMLLFIGLARMGNFYAILYAYFYYKFSLPL